MECTLNQVDPQFETTQGFNYRLSILLWQDGFSFLVTHAVSQRVMKMASYKLNHTGVQNDELGGWPAIGDDYFIELKKSELTSMKFERVDIAVASQKITIAPHDFLEPENVYTIISAAYPVSPAEEILSEPVFDPGPVTAILIPKYISEYCSEIFPGSFLRSAASVFVKGILHKYSQLITRQVFVNIHPGFFEITVIQGQRLLFLNAFKYSAPSDVLYYVIFVLEQLGFVPSEEKVTLMGDVSESSVIFTQLKMYCETLQFAGKPDEFKFGEAFAGTAMHEYFILLNIPICE